MKKTALVVFLVVVIIFSSLHLALGVDLPLIYAQDNPEWKDTQYDSGGTIENLGCFLTSFSMLLAYYGYPVDPPTLNDWMNKNEGYTSYGGILWNVPERYTVKAVYQTGSGIDYGKADLNLSKGYPVIAQVHTSTIGMHFVVIINKLSNGYEIVDPIGGRKTSLKNEGYIVDNLLFYKGPVPNSFVPPLNPPDPSSPILPQPQVDRVMVLLIDNWWYENNNQANDNIDLWVDLLPLGTKVWIVSFTKDVTPIIKGVTVDTDAYKVHLKKAIRSLMPHPESNLFWACETNNDLNKALEYALEVLKSQNVKERIVPIVSDGKNDPTLLTFISPKIRPEIYAGYRENNIKIYPIPVPVTRWETLKEIAEKTGGILSQEVYERDPGNGQRNTLLYQAGKLIPESPEQRPTFEKTYQFRNSGEEFEDFLEVIPGTIRKEIFHFWKGSRFEIVELTDPDGRVIDLKKDPTLYHSVGETYETLILLHPTPGIWEFKVRGIEVPPTLQGEETKIISWQEVDNKGPNIDFQYFDQFESGPLNFDLRVTDTVGVKEIGLYVRKKDQTWKPIKIQKNPKPDFKEEWNPKDGRYKILIQALDFFGNQTVTGQEVVVDSTAPQLDDFRVRRPGLLDNRVSVSFEMKEKWPKNTTIIVRDGSGEKNYPIQEIEVNRTFRVKKLRNKPIEVSVISEDKAGNVTKIDEEFNVTFLSRLTQSVSDLGKTTGDYASTTSWLKFWLKFLKI